jgi:hypothetical protein
VGKGGGAGRDTGREKPGVGDLQIESQEARHSLARLDRDTSSAFSVQNRQRSTAHDTATRRSGIPDKYALRFALSGATERKVTGL